MSPSSTTPSRKQGLLYSLGPAIIVASVVLGPGSILTSSKVGCQYGYDILWVVAFAGLLMFTMTALAARVGVALKRTPCAELAARGGRPFAAFKGPRAANGSEIDATMLHQRLFDLISDMPLADEASQAVGQQVWQVRIHSAAGGWAGRSDHCAGLSRSRTHEIHNFICHVDR